jgi:type IV pilus assembly protein PilE
MYRDCRRSPRGVTLIELVIVVAVVAVLAAIALPSYQSSVRKAHRTEAKAALSTAAQMMERYMTEKGTYATATLGVGGVYPDQSENGYYRLSFPEPAPNPDIATYMLSAAPLGSQGSDECGTFTLTQGGVRGVTGGTLTAAECW